MSDYRRLISYIYSYEKGIKMRNSGFARVESQGGICKINISLRISEILMNDTSDHMLEVFMFARRNGEVHKTNIGRIRIINGNSIFRGQFDAGNIGNGRLPLSDIVGIFICSRSFLNRNSQVNIVYASEWDDTTILVDEFAGSDDIVNDDITGTMDDTDTDHISSDANPGTMTGASENTAISNITDTSENTAIGNTTGASGNTAIGNMADTSGNTAIGNTAGTSENAAIGDATDTSENAVIGNTTSTSESAAIGNTTGTSGNVNIDHITGKSEIANHNKNRSTENLNTGINQNDKKDGQETIDIKENEGYNNIVDQDKMKRNSDNTVADMSAAELLKNQGAENQNIENVKMYEKQLQEILEKSDNNVKQQATANRNQRTSVNNSGQPAGYMAGISNQSRTPGTADYFRMLCNCYPKIKVDELSGECIRITPHDITYLPKKYWHLCNNSFLLHAYYNYRYILLCEEDNTNFAGTDINSDANNQSGNYNTEKRYMICVPGMMQKKEQAMAGMYGFTKFESKEQGELKNFGYWCMYL